MPPLVDAAHTAVAPGVLPVRVLALEYVALLPDERAVQSLLVVHDVLCALGYQRPQVEALLGTQVLTCIDGLAGDGCPALVCRVLG